ncbi:hypothetical protein A2709_03175 [candidate division WWE3 bacterium RIFCSPHIGHO2_01_FULL_43_9]|uniref:N-acetyltransferase domain-containing protein n=1 Tax=candidate division WWE3 bacterium RIFCSPHIGHO2_01_FULL_43_9 TaxID=1802618 RepID=A0A1F4V355_UNCKA|nr:MAG: hypothetical protein A2709_03175 [candidate division WWE3 bacterium RIFCSPHIGHO2_01_FULL_43_9]
MGTIKVRKAKISDAQDIALIHTHTWQYAYRGQLPDSFLDNISVEKRLKMWSETCQILKVSQESLWRQRTIRLLVFARFAHVGIVT